MAETTPTGRYEFVLLFDVQDGNPNGDPDAGNLPRTDPETGHGLVTDVALKRKVRNHIAATRGDVAPYKIYVAERAVLNLLHAQGYAARNIALASAVQAPLLQTVIADPSTLSDLPEGFSIGEDDESDSEPPQWIARYDGSLDKKELKDALTAIKTAYGTEVQKFFAALAKSTKSRKATPAERDDVCAWMCSTFFDVRTFGAVMSTKVNAGQVRGPVQLTFARSIDRVVTLEHAITRVAVATEKEAEAQGGDNRTMGRKATIPYGLYRAHGFVSPVYAKRTGFTKDDLAVLWEALENLFENDRSAARGLMATRALVIFEHASALGDASAASLFERLTVTRKPEVAVARGFGDYEVKLDGAALPAGVVHRYTVKREPVDGKSPGVNVLVTPA